MEATLGMQKDSNFCFLGNYINRGQFSMRLLLLVLAMKIALPKRVVLLRGCHESRIMTECFSFRIEVLLFYDAEVYELILQVFECLPLACVVDNQYFLVHAGIGPNTQTLSDIMSINRFKDHVPH